jgi:hypothetical protein
MLPTSLGHQLKPIPLLPLPESGAWEGDASKDLLLCLISIAKAILTTEVTATPKIKIIDVSIRTAPSP